MSHLFPIPRCAVCNKPAQRLTARPDMGRQVFNLTAYCHGKMDHCIFPFQYFIDGPLRFVDAVAFKEEAAKGSHFDTKV